MWFTTYTVGHFYCSVINSDVGPSASVGDTELRRRPIRQSPGESLEMVDTEGEIGRNFVEVRHMEEPLYVRHEGSLTRNESEDVPPAVSGSDEHLQ